MMRSDSDEIENVPFNPNHHPPTTNTTTNTNTKQPPKIDKTPLKSRPIPPSFLLRTPERQAFSNAPKNRFGFSTLNESRDDHSSRNNHSASLNLTPRVSGRTTSTATYSDVTSNQTTPTKSVTKPPNPAYLYTTSRNPAHASARPASHSRPFSSSSTPHPSLVNTVDVSHFDLKEDPSFWMDHNVQVIIRVRPLNGNEKTMYGYNRCVKQDSAHCITWIPQPETRFTFDHVACETVDQEMLFRMAGLPMVENCLSGYNSCMFAYGQTGSGKTYTMLGEMEDVEFTPSPHRGMTPRIFEFLFARIRAEEESRRDEKLKYSCKCSFLEIYNEQITDLLDPSSTNLLLREDVKKGVYVENLSEFEVHTVGDILGLLIQGSSNRKVAATNMNRESSRSHCVFICIIESKWERDSVTNYRFARLNLVDLAGSERQKSSGAEGDRLKEAANINKSLSTLGHVIMLLVDIAHGKPRHIPYRDSRLTFLLQDSLGGNSKTMIIANVSPSICCAAETLNTLKFAQRAKLIQNNAVVNEDSSGDVAVLQHQIWLLKEELSALKCQNVSRTLAFDQSTSISSQVNSEEEMRSENDQVNASEDLVESESKGGVRVSSKQFKSLEMMLAGALRREQMAETSLKQLEAEIEQLNRLVRQREEDTRCTKMKLKFREDKIQRLESLLGEMKPVDAYLLEENATLCEEIQMLQSKVDRNPEVTRFAVENIRLLEELRRFQDFYEEGERDLLMNEVSELRAQLIRFHDDSMQQHIVSNIAQDAAIDRKEHESLTFKLTNTTNELAQCQTKLKSCLETNSKLSREIEELHAQLRNKDSELIACHNILDAMKDLQVPKIPSQAHGRVVDENRIKHGDLVSAEELVNLELELDILKIILKEEKQSRWEMEELASSLTRDVQSAEQQVACISKQLKDAEVDLAETKSVIQALESQQLLSTAEIEDLKNHNLELLRKQEVQISALKEQASCQESSSCLKNSDSECTDSPLQEQLKRMQASLDKAKRLNMWYQSDHAYQRSNEEEMDEIRRQAEAETAEVIVCLQEELSVLQERVHESDLREKEAENKLLILETEMKEMHEAFDRLSSDNQVLCQNLQQKEMQIKLLADDWALLSCEIEAALIEGHEALRSASDELDSASTSSQRALISERVGKMIRHISDQELLIQELNTYLEEANIKTSDLEHMLMSLKGATIVMSEAHQKEFSEKEKEILQLKSELQASFFTEKEEMYMSEKNRLESMHIVEVGVLSLQAAFTDFERQCQSKFLAMNHKLKTLEEHAKEAKHSWLQTKELLEYELLDSKAATAQKAMEASCLLVRFEEVQDTMKEADLMINGLMIANETMKLEIEDLRNMDVMLNGEIERLMMEVQTLQSANVLKDQRCNYLENQLALEASSTASLIEELQCLVSATQHASEEAVTSLTHDFYSVISQVKDALNMTRASLEEIWSENVLRDCTLSVIHLCHIGILSDAVSVINFENDLHHDICESKTLISSLREQNTKLRQEMEICRQVNERLLSDLKSSLNHISNKDGEISELHLKLDSFKENLVALQRQEELMLETCNFMGSKLTMLEDESNQSNLTVAASLVEQEKLLKNNAKLIESQAEVFSVELYAKDLEVSLMTSEIQQLAQFSNYKLTMLEDELTRSNLAVAASLVEQEKLHKNNAKLIEFQAEVFSVELYAKDLEVSLMTSEIQQLAQFSNYKLTMLEDELTRSNLAVAASLVEQEKLHENNAKLLESQAEVFSVELYAKDLEVSLLTSEIQQLAQFSNYKLTTLEDELTRSNLTVTASLMEQEKLHENNAKLIESQIEVFSVELYAKDLEISLMTLEIQQLAQFSNYKFTTLEDELTQSNLTVAASLVEQEKLHKSNVKLIESQAEVFSVELYAKDLEVSLLTSEIQELAQFSNYKLTTLEDELTQNNLTLAASLVEQEKLNENNAKLIESQAEVFSIELHAKDLEVSRMTSEIQQLAQRNSDMDKQHLLCCTALDSLVTEIVTLKIFADLREELLFEKESEVDCLHTTIKKAMDSESRVFTQLQALSTLSSKVAKCAYSVETTELQSCSTLNQLQQNLVLVLDQISEDSCQNLESVSKFLEELDCVDFMAKEILTQNLSLNEMLVRKDEIVKGLLFDLRLLQESASDSKIQQDQIDEMEVLEAKVEKQRDILSATTMELENANLSFKILLDENEELKSRVEEIMAAKTSFERETCEKRSAIDSLENELLEMGNTLGQMNNLVESLKSNLADVNSEKDHLQKELLILEGKLETAHALAGENEAIAVEAQQIAESRRIYAEEKEEEVQLLERSVQELDSTISVLENKVDVLKGETERQRLQREELEVELHSFKNQMQSVEFADSEIKRHLDEKTRNLQEALMLIKVLEKDLAHRDTEIAQCRAHISELSLHAESQACEYKQKFKELEAMLEQFRAEAVTNHERNASCNKLEKNPSKARGSASPFKAKGSSSPFKGRGSGSPFKCIGLGFVNQLKSEKDEDINAEKLRIGELEALADSRQKEIFMLNARLAATESMTHDVIRDLLGVKLDMNNCANLLDKQQVKRLMEMGHVDIAESQDHKVINLKKQINEFIVERKGWLEEIDRRETELVAAQIALEELREQVLFLSTENSVLKRDLTNHKRQVAELEEEVKKLSGQQNLQQRIHHHAKIKEENNILKMQNKELSAKVRQAEAYRKTVKKGIDNLRASNGMEDSRQTSRRMSNASFFSAIDR
ncbi:kinesin-like protein KIN-12D isoform X2 [Silene latifolia]|uniref:kinesin-like protein KIN-12D isoform X2 n=1 Tax=Silene latifolia TaxID=37657 RepID=UPI003D787F7B